MIVGHQVLLKIIQQDIVDVVQAHIGNETPQGQGEELGDPLAPRRVPRRSERQGEHYGAEHDHYGDEYTLRHKYAVVGHLEDQLADKAYHVVYPLADLGLCRHSRTLGVVVNGLSEVFHIVDQFVPPVRILADCGDLLRRRYGILHGAEAFKVFTLLLRHFKLQCRHLLVFRHSHSLGGGLQRLAGYLKGRAYP